MSDLRVLEEGRMRRSARDARRRRVRRRHQVRRGVAALLLLGVVLLAAEIAGGGIGSGRSRAGGGGHPTARGAAGRAGATGTLASSTDAITPLAYGRALSRVQILHPGLKLPLASGELFDVDSGRVLWERHAARRLPIASLTKMMTALVVAERSRSTDRVMITTAATHFTGSGVGLLPLHKRVPEIALLYGLLLPSGNDAAIALAQHVAGDQARFIDLMNGQAASMPLPCTHFATVSGVVDGGNYSCAADLAVLAHAVLEHPMLRRIVGSGSAIVPFPIKGHKLFLYNNNPLLRAGFPGADGVKTGFTTKAGLCIVATARRGGHWLGVVLLHSGNWMTQAETLLNDGFRALSSARR